MRPSPKTELPSSWYELGRLYARAGEDARRATMEGFALALVAGASVLLSAPLFGTAWAGPFAVAIPVAAGLLFGVGLLGWRRARFTRRRKALSQYLHAAGEDPARPTLGGLGAYYDVQLLLLRCEYEYLRERRGARAARSARLLEDAFGFAPEDGFECGPLNVAPDTEEMRVLRGRWGERLAVRRGLGGGFPAFGLREDRAFRVFPREMTVPQELATRGAYLEISCRLLRERYRYRRTDVSEDVRRRAERDLGEYRALVRR